jgi:hypothetical protein
MSSRFPSNRGLKTNREPEDDSDQEVVGYVRECNAHQAPMTFNVGIYQDGTMAETSVEQLRRLNVALKGSK